MRLRLIPREERFFAQPILVAGNLLAIMVAVFRDRPGQEPDLERPPVIIGIIEPSRRVRNCLASPASLIFRAKLNISVPSSSPAASRSTIGRTSIR